MPRTREAHLVTPGSFAFMHPALLLLLPLAALPWLGFSAYPSPYPSLAALPRDGLSDWIGRGLRVLACLCMASIVLALAAPYRGERQIEKFAPGAEIVLLLDRSSSMDQPFAREPNATAFAGRPEPKALVAQRLLSQFTAGRTHDRTGMVVFSTLPIPIIGLTLHGELVQAAIGASVLGRGLAETDLGRGLTEALSYFEGRPYSGSRVILLVSDGGAELDAETRSYIARTMKRDHVALYWLYLRSFHSPGIGTAAAPPDAGAGNPAPERALHEFFRTMGAPYRLYQAQNPHALEQAIEDVGRLEDLPIQYMEVLPPKDYSGAAYSTALLLALVLLAAKMLEIERWS
jgi:mxaC protein